MRRQARCALIVLSVVAWACTRDAPYERFATPWTSFLRGHGLDGAYDSSRLVAHGDEVDVWLRFQYEKPQSVGSPPTEFSSMEIHESVRCAAQQVRDDRMLTRDAKGDSDGAYTTPQPRWISFAKHGMTERVFLPLCAALRGR